MDRPVPASHLTHDELASPAEMSADCRALTQRLPDLERAARAAVSTPPSLHFEDFPREVPKRELTVSEAAVRLAAALELHLG